MQFWKSQEVRKKFKNELLFLDGRMLDDPIGGAADGFVALHQGDIHIGLDLFEGLLGAVSALLQVLVDLLFGGNEVFGWP